MYIRPTYYKLTIAAVLVLCILAAVCVRIRPAVAAREDMEKAKQELIDKGDDLFSKGDYAGAVETWQSALTIDPMNGRIKRSIRQAEEKIVKPLGGDVKLLNMAATPPGSIPIWSQEQCIATAVRNHIPLQIAQKNVKLAELRLFEARRGLLPNVKLSIEETQGTVNERNYYGRKAYIEGQQTVYNGGENWFLTRQAELNFNIVKEEYARIRNELVLQVKKNYYTLSKAKANLLLQIDLKKDVDRIYTIVIKAYEASITTKLEYLNVLSQESQMDYQVASAAGDVDVAELIIKQTMNIDPRERVDIKPEIDFKKVDIDFDTVIRTAYVNRAEMKINSLLIEYYNYGLKIAKAKYWPKVDLMGNWGLAKESYCAIDNQAQINPTTGFVYTDPDRKMEQQWYAGIKCSMPFWGNTLETSYTREQWVPVVAAYQGTEARTKAVKLNILDVLKYDSDRQAADVDLDRSRQEFIKTKQDITLEAKEACFSYEKALIQLDTAQKKTVYTERDYEIKRYKASMGETSDPNASGPGSEVIDAMFRVAQEKYSYIAAQADCYIALATINKAIGIEDYYKVPAGAAKQQSDTR